MFKLLFASKVVEYQGLEKSHYMLENLQDTALNILRASTSVQVNHPVSYNLSQGLKIIRLAQGKPYFENATGMRQSSCSSLAMFSLNIGLQVH